MYVAAWILLIYFAIKINQFLKEGKQHYEKEGQNGQQQQATYTAGMEGWTGSRQGYEDNY